MSWDKQRVLEELMEDFRDGHQASVEDDVARQRYSQLLKYWQWLSYDDFASIWDISATGGVSYWANQIKDKLGINRKTTKKVTFDGERRSLYNLCQQLDFDLDLAAERANRGWEGKHIFQEAVTPDTFRCDAFDDNIRTLTEWSEAYDLDYSLVYNRIKSGSDLQTALTTPLKRKTRKLFGLPLSKWSEVTGLARDLLYSRIQLGWDDLEIITTPNKNSDESSRKISIKLVSAATRDDEVWNALKETDFFENTRDEGEVDYEEFIVSDPELKQPGFFSRMYNKVASIFN